jgi:hypothetical protein
LFGALGHADADADADADAEAEAEAGRTSWRRGHCSALWVTPTGADRCRPVPTGADSASPCPWGFGSFRRFSHAEKLAGPTRRVGVRALQCALIIYISLLSSF